MAVTFCLCLIVSNIFAVKLFCVFDRFTLSGAVIIFPISYILNDCLTEVYGYRDARKVIWMGFILNFAFVLVSQAFIALPGAGFWDGQEHVAYVLGAAPRAAVASLLAFLLGSNVNALIMSRMKSRDGEKLFGVRAIVSSIAGEAIDSLIFVPIVFFGLPLKQILTVMACQIVAKVCYEIIILPLTAYVVKAVKIKEGLIQA